MNVPLKSMFKSPLQLLIGGFCIGALVYSLYQIEFGVGLLRTGVWVMYPSIIIYALVGIIASYLLWDYFAIEYLVILSTALVGSYALFELTFKLGFLITPSQMYTYAGRWNYFITKDYYPATIFVWTILATILRQYERFEKKFYYSLLLFLGIHTLWIFTAYPHLYITLGAYKSSPLEYPTILWFNIIAKFSSIFPALILLYNQTREVETRI